MEQEFVCETCGKAFESSKQLRGHKMTCRGEEDQPQAETLPRERPEREDKPERAKRVPVGLPRQKLGFPTNQFPHKRFRVVNDTGNRINRFLAGWWEFVPRKMGLFGDPYDAGGRWGEDAQSVYVGQAKDGSPIRGYLMMIDSDLYEEDQKRKQDSIDETERQIMRGMDAHGQPGRDGRYVPKSGISIEHGG